MIVVVRDAGSYLRCFLGTTDKLRLFPGSLLGEILEQCINKAESEVGPEISVGCEL